MANTRTGTVDTVVVGGGVIGLASAWRLAQRGLRVSVLDPSPGSGASHQAAGMLAPVSEAHFGEQALLALNLASAGRWPHFVVELEESTGLAVGYRTEGTLVVAADEGDRALLAQLADYQESCGLRAEPLTRRECRALEPLLEPSVRAGLFARDDRSVDNRRLARALLNACERAGVAVVRERVIALLTGADRVEGVRLADGTRLSAGTVVLAAGCWSAGLAGLPVDAVPEVRPVKGQILRLRATGPFITHSVRALVAGDSVYLVPRLDGEVVLGATMEEMGFDTTVRAGAMYELLRDARTVLPGVSELELVEFSAGLRPGSPDNAPLIGPSAVDRLHLATGHHRNGVLLTPVTADAVAAAVVDGELPAEAKPFAPQRFAARASAGVAS